MVVVRVEGWGGERVEGRLNERVLGKRNEEKNCNMIWHEKGHSIIAWQREESPLDSILLLAHPGQATGN